MAGRPLSLRAMRSAVAIGTAQLYSGRPRRDIPRPPHQVPSNTDSHSVRQYRLRNAIVPKVPSVTVKRDRISEIRARKARQGNAHRMDWRTRHSFLDLALRSTKKSDLELLKYFPIGLVTMIEVYFKLAIEQLIDHGPPYSDHADKLANGTKFDMSMINALLGKTITIGQLLAHMVPINNLENINSALSSLFSKDFLAEIPLVHDRFEVEVHKKPKSPIIVDQNLTYRSISELFSLRHILVHEQGNNIKLDHNAIKDFFAHTEILLKASDEFIGNELYPGAPLTQSDMTKESCDQFTADDEKLTLLVGQLREEYAKNDPESLELFDKTCETWAEFRKMEAELFSNIARGGTLQPQLYCIEAGRLTHHRLDELGKSLETIQGLWIRDA